MILNETLDIEIWNYSAWSLNKFTGKLNVPLRNIVNGPIKRSHIVQGTKGADRKGILKLSYSFSM